MTDDKSPLDHAMDLLFFAPLGLAATARDLVPTLAQRGRAELDPQVGAARMVGQMAVAQGRNQAEKAVERAFAQAQATLRHFGLLGQEVHDGVDTAGSRKAPRPDPAPKDGAVPDPAVSGAAVRRPSRRSPAPGFSGAPAADASLAIPDYESLSASQVVPRLAGLTTEELEAVRAYEEFHRGRKTILNKIAQLPGS